MSEPAEFKVEATGDQMTVTVNGPLLADAVIALVQARYPQFHGRRLLWNLAAADVTRFSADDFTRVAIAVRNHTPADVNRRTAYVVSGQPEAIALWKYLNTSIGIHVPVEYKVFTSVPAAQTWLEQR